MKINKIFRLFITIKYLKFIQIYFRLFYYVRMKFRNFLGFTYSLSIPSHTAPLLLQTSILSADLLVRNEFKFLNLSQSFDNKIDWNISIFGKLWTYNINYFDYLNQKKLSRDKGLNLILNFIEQISIVQDGLEPYPISLRGINWIKFLTKHQIKNQRIDDSLYAQYNILIDNLEYHLLGNHLLENAFSLLFGAYYFRDEEFYKKAKQIFKRELEEQILKDGAHFELSPMYHQIMLYRVLDCINLIQNNNWKNKKLLGLFTSKAKLMLDWLNIMTFENGDIPLLNDSANHIAPTTKQLNDYASVLQVGNCHQSSTIKHQLNESGYRKFKNNNYETVVDVGNIGPDYIPGHAHSDTFSFELYVHGKPLIVDTGVSTYEANDRRQLERSSRSHNTVEIDGENQSGMWGGFRVAKRAKIIRLYETETSIESTHDGYQHKGILHTRKFIFGVDSITIYDTIKGGKTCMNTAYLHFHPEVDLQLDNYKTLLCNNCLVKFSGAKKVLMEPFKYAPEFNKLIESVCVKVIFDTQLEIKISIH